MPSNPVPSLREAWSRLFHEQDGRGTARGGRKPDSYYRVAVAAAVLQLDNRASLECNALAQLPAVGKLADERYPGKIWRRGLCLRDFVKEAVDETIDAADGPDMEKICFVLTRAASGDTLAYPRRARPVTYR